MIDRLRDHLERVRPLDGEALDDAAAELGALWGEAACTDLGWHWAVLTDGVDESEGVVAPEGSLVVIPALSIGEILEDPERANTIALLFQMIRAGNTPDAAPGELRWFR